MPHEPRLRSCKAGSITADYSGCDGVVAQKSHAETLIYSSGIKEEHMNTSHSKESLLLILNTRLHLWAQGQITMSLVLTFLSFTSHSALSHLSIQYLNPAEASEGDVHILCPV
ncbi:hypothetical protein M6B38_293495 [Iris pallida]|uniref:Uncharacterized protein n=1 Tax=Iris pallida TaxID=29817 RepID=A0AAX6HU79_IRIPA|nr:hypothetical protein M6B38_293495 [Iris pallida]